MFGNAKRICVSLQHQITQKKNKEMRKVKFKKFIPKAYENGRLIDGTGILEDEYTQEGVFHH